MSDNSLKHRGPRGGMLLFLILACMGGTFCSFLGCVGIADNTITRYFYSGLLIGGLVLLSSSVTTWIKLSQGKRSALAWARCVILVFFVFANFYIIRGTDGSSWIICLILEAIVLVWCGIWWGYLSDSKRLEGLTDCESKSSKSVKVVITVLAAILVVLGVSDYVSHLNRRHQVELNKLVSQLVNTDNIVEKNEINEELDEMETTDRSEEEETIETPPVKRQASQKKEYTGEKNVQNKSTVFQGDIFSIELPTGWSVRKDKEEQQLYGFYYCENSVFTLTSASDSADAAFIENDPITEFKFVLDDNPDIEKYEYIEQNRLTNRISVYKFKVKIKDVSDIHDFWAFWILNCEERIGIKNGCLIIYAFSPDEFRAEVMNIVKTIKFK